MANFKDNVQFILILALFAYVIFLQQCKGGDGSNEAPKIDTIVNIDTVGPPPVIVRLKPQPIPAPVVIYIDSTKNVVYNDDTTAAEKVQLYKDSITDENLTFYYESVIDGVLINNSFDYKLKVPREIKKTVTITKPVPVPVNSIMFKTGVGSNFNGRNSITVGAEFISKKGYSVGYNYDILQNQHNINLGVRLFKFK